jgi:type II secretory pathway pseudopilin PulG
MVVAIIAFLAAVAVPGFLRARKRSQASQIVPNLHFAEATPVHPA